MGRTPKDYEVRLPDGEVLGPYPGRKNAGERARAALDVGRLPNGTDIVAVETDPLAERYPEGATYSVERVESKHMNARAAEFAAIGDLEKARQYVDRTEHFNVVCDETGAVRSQRGSRMAAERKADALSP